MENKTAIITGGSSGLGLSTAKLFLKEGAKVVITGRNEDKLSKAKEELQEMRKEILAVRADVSKEEDVINTFEKTIEKFGTVDILINNAAVAMIKKLTDTTLEDWNNMFSINMTGLFLMTREAAKFMLKNKVRGKIVNISSVSGRIGGPMISAYSASKASVIGFTRAVAKELAPHGINVNSICPGAIDTDMFQKGTIDTLAEMFKSDREMLLKGTLSAIPLKRLLSPEEVAELVLYLSGSKSDGITGQSFNITCGLDMR